MKNSEATLLIRQLCKLGLSGTAVMPALLRAIRRLVPCDSAAFFWADERGDWDNLYAERMLSPELMQRYFDRYYESAAQSFRTRMQQCVALGAPIAQIEDPVEGSAYFEEILKPLDAYRILHLRLQDRGRPLGQLSLYRGARWAQFNSTETATIEGVARYLVQTLRPPTVVVRAGAADDFRDSEEGALVVCTNDGEVVSASHRANALLAHASGEAINRSTLAGAVPRKGRELLRSLAAGVVANAPLHESTPSTVAHNEWGRFQLSAYALGESQLGVLIRRQEHFLVRVIDAMRTLKLSAQQREVAVLLARGMTNIEIAQQLGVALNTSSYHVKQLYQKLDAHDRTHAIARILGGHTRRQ